MYRRQAQAISKVPRFNASRLDSFIFISNMITNILYYLLITQFIARYVLTK